MGVPFSIAPAVRSADPHEEDYGIDRPAMDTEIQAWNIDVSPDGPYVTTLYDYLRQAVPFNAPQSLTPDEIHALTA